MAAVAVANKSWWRPRLARLDSKSCPTQYKHFGPLNILWAENDKVQPTWAPFDFLDKDYGRAVLLGRPWMVECRPAPVGWARGTYFHPQRAWGRLSADVNLDLWIFQQHLCFFFLKSSRESSSLRLNCYVKWPKGIWPAFTNFLSPGKISPCIGKRRKSVKFIVCREVLKTLVILILWTQALHTSEWAHYLLPKPAGPRSVIMQRHQSMTSSVEEEEIELKKTEPKNKTKHSPLQTKQNKKKPERQLMLWFKGMYHFSILIKNLVFRYHMIFTSCVTITALIKRKKLKHRNVFNTKSKMFPA